MSEEIKTAENAAASNFIHDFIDEDLKEGEKAPSPGHRPGYNGKQQGAL